MTKNAFKKATRKFDKIEDTRGKLYYRALKLVEAKLSLEAHILILATWNTAAFRYALRKFNLRTYQKAVERVSCQFKTLRKSDLMETDLKPFRRLIVNSFNALKKINGVGFTGASKVLHLINTRLFVPWDNYISGQKMRKDLKNLPVVRSGLWTSDKFERNGRGYYKFLIASQETFRHLVFEDSQKTHAKQIDEFNFVNITVPLQKIQTTRERKKKREKARKRASQPESHRHD